MIEKIFLKRNQVRHFDQKNIPDNYLIYNLIKKTHTLVPSKQNLMPYTIHILGPSNIKIKEKLFELASKHELPTDYEKRIENLDTGNTALFAPYVLLFEKRLPEPNNWVNYLIKERGHTFEECDPNLHFYHNNITAIEVGLFCAIFTGLCLENNLSISYTECLPNVTRQHNKFGELVKINPYSGVIDFIQEDIFLALSLGFEDKSVNLNKRLAKFSNQGETKPTVNKIIKWHD